ncbi:uncharacterized protein RSE6_03220 [Rhynchosporium secalis]|uniref:Heterokaryon incompatibility domain-containing protein n=1 Tax=Rhynchosporium secalis TaxID=38038 RepID=A0A1E1M2B3_RHYSE|nr:uncharacterized protein RSE6_03220 [Rhynchosporium secalis]
MLTTARSSEELHWECQSKHTCECGQCSIDSQKFIMKVHGQDEDYQPRNWQEVVRFYSALSLTYENDRLPALSGIASSLISKPNYLAGLRRQSLVFDLNWMHLGTLGSDAKESGVPSWSWPAIKSSIEFFPYEKLDPRLEIIEAECVLKTSNPFGEVSGGFVTLKGATFETCFAFCFENSQCLEWLDTSELEGLDFASDTVLLLYTTDDVYAYREKENSTLVLRKYSDEEATYQRIGSAICNVKRESVDAPWDDLPCETRVTKIV